jgi:hypothetical protein
MIRSSREMPDASSMSRPEITGDRHRLEQHLVAGAGADGGKPQTVLVEN